MGCGPVLRFARFGLVRSLIVVKRRPGAIPHRTGTVAFHAVLTLIIAWTKIDTGQIRARVILRETSKLALWVVWRESDHGLARSVDHRRGSRSDRATLEHCTDCLGAWRVRRAVRDRLGAVLCKFSGGLRLRAAVELRGGSPFDRASLRDFLLRGRTNSTRC
jgi:hypothetical protein